MRRTHRVLGVSSLLFLVLIALTGLILNHADDLGLSRTAAAPWLIGLYGVDLPPVDSAFSAGGVQFATSAETLFANGDEVLKDADRLTGAVAVDDVIVVATRDEFFITDSTGALIERYTADLSIKQMGTVDQRIYISDGEGIAEFDAHQMSLVAIDNGSVPDITWSQPGLPDAAQVRQIGLAALGQALNWERVLLDVHSGRILPGLGRWLADLTALALLYMCGTGIVLWTRRR
ncbi:MAG TPA: PepSY domain-containing protein [Woeseiaceae bacterium]|nr:PepSY domain-containing protein [Woeseiaceae bacterium]